MFFLPSANFVEMWRSNKKSSQMLHLSSVLIGEKSVCLSPFPGNTKFVTPPLWTPSQGHVKVRLGFLVFKPPEVETHPRWRWCTKIGLAECSLRKGDIFVDSNRFCWKPGFSDTPISKTNSLRPTTNPVACACQDLFFAMLGKVVSLPKPLS